jgi:hypothetical protein
MLRQKAAVAGTGIEAKRCNSLLKMEQIVSAAAVEQKFVRVFCVPTQITASHAPSIPRAHAQRAAAATHTPLQLHSHGAGSSSAAASQTLPTKSNGRGTRRASRKHVLCVCAGCAAEPDYGDLERTQPLGFVSCGHTAMDVDDALTGAALFGVSLHGHCTDFLY